jgi:hypothetical protein
MMTLLAAASPSSASDFEPDDPAESERSLRDRLRSLMTSRRQLESQDGTLQEQMEHEFREKELRIHSELDRIRGPLGKASDPPPSSPEVLPEIETFIRDGSSQSWASRRAQYRRYLALLKSGNDRRAIEWLEREFAKEKAAHGEAQAPGPPGSRSGHLMLLIVVAAAAAAIAYGRRARGARKMHRLPIVFTAGQEQKIL